MSDPRPSSEIAREAIERFGKDALVLALQTTLRLSLDAIARGDLASLDEEHPELTPMEGVVARQVATAAALDVRDDRGARREAVLASLTASLLQGVTAVAIGAIRWAGQS